MSTNDPPFQVEHHHARLADVSLHYVSAGEGEPVVLLHGWPSTWYEWRQVMPLLAARFRVIAPDLRGLGDSSRPLAGYDKKTVAADLWQLLSGTLGLSRWHLVGHDWGGPVAFALAAAHPEAIRTLAIVDVTVPGIGPDISQGGKRWHHAFHMTPDLPEALVQGRERDSDRRRPGTAQDSQGVAAPGRVRLWEDGMSDHATTTAKPELVSVVHGGRVISGVLRYRRVAPKVAAAIRAVAPANPRPPGRPIAATAQIPRTASA